MDIVTAGDNTCRWVIIEGLKGAAKVTQEVTSSTLAKEGELADMVVINLHASGSCSWDSLRDHGGHCIYCCGCLPFGDGGRAVGSHRVPQPQLLSSCSCAMDLITVEEARMDMGRCGCRAIETTIQLD